MPVASDLIPPIEWSNWRYGDWGSYGGDSTFLRYHSVNCQVYEDGSIGPRPGWKSLATAEGANKIIPRALVWRQPGVGEETLEPKRWLMIVGSSNSKETILLLEVNPQTGALASSKRATVTKVIPQLPWGTYDQPRWWGGQSTDYWYHVATRGGGSLVTVHGAVFHRVLTDDGGIYLGYRVTAKSLDNKTTYTPTIAEPFGEIMYYAGAAGNGAALVWYSRKGDYQDLQEPTQNPDTPKSNFQRIWDTNLVSTPHNGVTMLQETNNGLLVGNLNGQLIGLAGESPEVGTVRQIQEIGAPNRPWAYCLVGGEAFFMNADGRGVVFGGLNGVDARSFKHLRWPIRYTKPGRYRPIKVSGRGGVLGRAVGSPFAQFMLLSSRRDSDLASSVGNPFATLEFNNGVWTPGEFVGAEHVDYCVIPGGRLGRALTTATKTAIDVRDQTLNAPVTSERNWSVPLADEEGYGKLVGDDEAKSAILLLPQIPLRGVGKISVRDITIEIDYWKRTTPAPAWEPELTLYVHMCTEKTGSLSELGQVDWNRTDATFDLIGKGQNLREGEGVRHFVTCSKEFKKYGKTFAGEYESGYSMQLAFRFNCVSIHRVIPRLNFQQWRQFVDPNAALASAGGWGLGGAASGGQ